MPQPHRPTTWRTRPQRRLQHRWRPPPLLPIEDDEERNASREDQNAAISGSALTASWSGSSPYADAHAVSALGGAVSSPSRSSPSENASLLLKRGLDGGSGEEGGSVSDHKRRATVSQSSSSSSSSASLPVTNKSPPMPDFARVFVVRGKLATNPSLSARAALLVLVPPHILCHHTRLPPPLLGSPPRCCTYACFCSAAATRAARPCQSHDR
jgi:hypothetical protein